MNDKFFALKFLSILRAAKKKLFVIQIFTVMLDLFSICEFNLQSMKTIKLFFAVTFLLILLPVKENHYLHSLFFC